MRKLVGLSLVAASFSLLVGCGSGGKDITATSSAEDVYAQSCAGCHNGGLRGWLTGAPAVDDKEAWQPLVSKGVDAMTAITIQGMGKMPAKGGCETCSEDQIKGAVEHLANLVK